MMDACMCVFRMVRVRQRLEELGFKTWMDVDNMCGSTLEAMATAVSPHCPTCHDTGPIVYCGERFMTVLLAGRKCRCCASGHQSGLQKQWYETHLRMPRECHANVTGACRTESEFAYKLKKPIIPILLEHGYIA